MKESDSDNTYSISNPSYRNEKIVGDSKDSTNTEGNIVSNKLPMNKKNTFNTHLLKENNYQNEYIISNTSYGNQRSIGNMRGGTNTKSNTYRSSQSYLSMSSYCCWRFSSRRNTFFISTISSNRKVKDSDSFIQFLDNNDTDIRVINAIIKSNNKKPEMIIKLLSINLSASILRLTDN